MICRAIDTLSALVTAYGREHDIKPQSAQQLEITVGLLVRWYESLTGLPAGLHVLNEGYINDFLHDMRESRGWAAKTANRKRGDILTLWRFAAGRSLADPPDESRIIRFKEPERAPEAWPLDELQKFLAACDSFEPTRPTPGWTGRHDRAVALVMYYTAYRFTACFKLRRQDLRDDGAILARAETQKTICDEVRWLGPDAVAAVKAITSVDSELLFAWPYQKEAYWRRWKRILRHAGLSATRRDGPQKMRRSSASHLEAACPGAAQRHLGHKTAGLAYKHYVDPRIAPAQNAARILPRITEAQQRLF